MRYPTRFQQKTLWNAATGVSLLILGALVTGLVVLIGKVFGYLQPVLIPVIVAGIVAYVLDPVVRWMETRGLSRLAAVSALFAALLLAVALLVLAVLPGIKASRDLVRGFITSNPAAEEVVEALTRNDDEGEADETPGTAPEPTAESDDPSPQLAQTLAKSLRNMRDRQRDGLIGWALAEVDDEGKVRPQVEERDDESLEFFWQTRVGRALFEYKGEILSTVRNWITAGSTKLMGFLGLLLGMIMVPIYLFFFLKDSAAIRDHWHDYVPLKTSRFKTELIGTLQEINGYLISFFRGQVVVAVIDGILVGIALELFQLPYGFLIGVFMAILGVIPYIGNIICLIPTCVIAFLHAQGGNAPFGLGPWAYVGFVIAIFILVQQINSLVTAPKIVGDSVGLHPLTVIFSMLFWTIVLGGFVGALLAVPFTAAIKVLFRRFIWERKMYETAGAP